MPSLKEAQKGFGEDCDGIQMGCFVQNCYDFQGHNLLLFFTSIFA